jgi:hypothetical protein
MAEVVGEQGAQENIWEAGEDEVGGTCSANGEEEKHI